MIVWYVYLTFLMFFHHYVIRKYLKSTKMEDVDFGVFLCLVVNMISLLYFFTVVIPYFIDVYNPLFVLISGGK
jgi:hypothetical protein